MLQLRWSGTTLQIYKKHLRLPNISCKKRFTTSVCAITAFDARHPQCKDIIIIMNAYAKNGNVGKMSEMESYAISASLNDKWKMIKEPHPKRVCQNRNSVVLRTRNPTNLYKSNKSKCWYTEWKILDGFVRFAYGDFQFCAKRTSSSLTHPQHLTGGILSE